MSEPRPYLVRIEDDNERPAVVILEAESVEEAERRVRYLLKPTSARIVGGIVPSRLSPAMARTLA